MSESIPSNNTRQITINGLKITVNFAEDRNISTENSIGKLLLENMFKGGSNYEKGQDVVSELNAKTVCKAG